MSIFVFCIGCTINKSYVRQLFANLGAKAVKATLQYDVVHEYALDYNSCECTATLLSNVNTHL